MDKLSCYFTKRAGASEVIAYNRHFGNFHLCPIDFQGVWGFRNRCGPVATHKTVDYLYEHFILCVLFISGKRDLRLLDGRWICLSGFYLFLRPTGQMWFWELHLSHYFYQKKAMTSWRQQMQRSKIYIFACTRNI